MYEYERKKTWKKACSLFHSNKEIAIVICKTCLTPEPNAFSKLLSRVLFKNFGEKGLSSHAHKCDFPPVSRVDWLIHPADQMWCNLFKNNLQEAFRVSSNQKHDEVVLHF